jgi:DNA-directed RNA polymerase II subunit RPB3
VETVGGLEPDEIVQQGIRVLQQKLGVVIQELQGDDQRNGYESPGYTPGTAYGDQGYNTEYGQGQQSAWGGGFGGQTPAAGAATPYDRDPW